MKLEHRKIFRFWRESFANAAGRVVARGFSTSQALLVAWFQWLLVETCDFPARSSIGHPPRCRCGLCHHCNVSRPLLSNANLVASSLLGPASDTSRTNHDPSFLQKPRRRKTFLRHQQKSKAKGTIYQRFHQFLQIDLRV